MLTASTTDLFDLLGKLQGVQQEACDVLQMGQHQLLKGFYDHRHQGDRPVAIESSDRGFLGDRWLKHFFSPQLFSVTSLYYSDLLCQCDSGLIIQVSVPPSVLTKADIKCHSVSEFT